MVNLLSSWFPLIFLHRSNILTLFIFEDFLWTLSFFWYLVWIRPLWRTRRLLHCSSRCLGKIDAKKKERRKEEWWKGRECYIAVLLLVGFFPTKAFTYLWAYPFSNLKLFVPSLPCATYSTTLNYPYGGLLHVLLTPQICKFNYNFCPPQCWPWFWSLTEASWNQNTTTYYLCKLREVI